MAISDLFISRRERFLNKILGVDALISLDPAPCDPGPELKAEMLAGNIKKTLNHTKDLAVSADGSQVDYQLLARNAVYQSYSELVCELRDFDYQELKGYDQQLAFWINLYNALVIDGVIQDDIKTSVTESRLGILGFFQRNAYTFKDQRFSLTDIEHGVLRANRGVPYLPGRHFANGDPRMNSVLPRVDPRIHFALNCASLSCPPIGVYSGDKIQEQLDQAAINFINNDIQVFLDKKEISVSRIFQWYLSDFGGKKMLPSFLANYLLNKETRQWILKNQSRVKIKFHTYDWKLNNLQI